MDNRAEGELVFDWIGLDWAQLSLDRNVQPIQSNPTNKNSKHKSQDNDTFIDCSIDRFIHWLRSMDSRQNRLPAFSLGYLDHLDDLVVVVVDYLLLPAVMYNTELLDTVRVAREFTALGAYEEASVYYKSAITQAHAASASDKAWCSTVTELRLELQLVSQVIEALQGYMLVRTHLRLGLFLITNTFGCVG